MRLTFLMCCARLWTDVDNYNLIKDHYAWFLDTYESLPKPVMKADSARYLYMYHIGGARVAVCSRHELKGSSHSSIAAQQGPCHRECCARFTNQYRHYQDALALP